MPLILILSIFLREAPTPVMCQPSLLTASVWPVSAVNIKRKVHPTSIAYELFHPPPIPVSPAPLKPTFLHLTIY
jgi:hypothetical protein